MPNFAIVDSHVHLCEPKRFTYAWMATAPSLNRRRLPEDFVAAAAPVKIEQFVFVEVDVDHPQHVEEAAWVAGLAKADERLTGIVASLPIEQGKAVEPELHELLRIPILRGIRRLIQSHPDPEFCIRPKFIEGLRLLSSHGLPFDICILPHQMPSVIKMVRSCPEVRFVLDHIGKPAIRDGALDPWRAHLAELAGLPNVFCKISGVITEADHRNWTREQVQPYILHAIESFGFDRVMFGGDWHVVELAGTYPRWVETLDWAVAGATSEEKRKLYRDNAIRFYGLEPPQSRQASIA